MYVSCMWVNEFSLDYNYVHLHHTIKVQDRIYCIVLEKMHGTWLPLNSEKSSNPAPHSITPSYMNHAAKLDIKTCLLPKKVIFFLFYKITFFFYEINDMKIKEKSLHEIVAFIIDHLWNCQWYLKGWKYWGTNWFI